MSQIRPITPNFAVAPAPGPGFFEDAKAQGYGLIINNRPDGEDPAQLSSAAAEAAARALGLDYLYIPVSGMPGSAQAAAMAQALAGAEQPVLAFCRSGTRSAASFALAQALTGADIDATLAMTRAAGYELSQLAPLMGQLKP